MNEGPVIGDGGFVFALEKRGYVKAGPWTPEATVEHPEAGECVECITKLMTKLSQLEIKRIQNLIPHMTRTFQPFYLAQQHPPPPPKKKKNEKKGRSR